MSNENVITNNQTNIIGSDDLYNLAINSNKELNTLTESIRNVINNYSFLETNELWVGTESEKYKARYFDLKNNIDKIINRLETIKKSFLTIATELTNANQSSLDANYLTTIKDKALKNFFSAFGEEMLVPTDVDTHFKSYTAYNLIRKDKNNNGNYNYKQSAIVYGDLPDANGVKYETFTDPESKIRYVKMDGENYYCAAMGDYYGNVGDTFKITTTDGNEFDIIVCDAKSTKDSNSYNVNGKALGHWHNGHNTLDIVEFYYDPNYSLPDMVRKMGSFNYDKNFSGNIKQILKTSDYENRLNNN